MFSLFFIKFYQQLRFICFFLGNKGENIKDIRDKFNQVQIFFPGPGERNDIVKIRGPKEDVDKCAKHLEKLVKELHESSHKIDLPIYKQFHKFIIGKGKETYVNIHYTW